MLEGHLRTVVPAVVGIVNFAILPRAVARAAKSMENCKPQEGSCAQRGIRILQIDQGSALSVRSSLNDQ